MLNEVLLNTPTIDTLELFRAAGSVELGAVEHVVDEVGLVVVNTAVSLVHGLLELVVGPNLLTGEHVATVPAVRLANLGSIL